MPMARPEHSLAVLCTFLLQGPLCWRTTAGRGRSKMKNVKSWKGRTRASTEVSLLDGEEDQAIRDEIARLAGCTEICSSSIAFSQSYMSYVHSRHLAPKSLWHIN